MGFYMNNFLKINKQNNIFKQEDINYLLILVKCFSS